MAASQVLLNPEHRPVFAVEHLTAESAKRASQLLQENHDKFHVFFNDRGFHNHVTHHIMTLFAIGASPPAMQKQFNDNATMQMPHKPLKRAVVDEVATSEGYAKHLGKGNNYRDFLVFFQEEMEKRDWRAIVNEYLFAGDERANDMLVRLFGGLIHPLIHLGFGIEFDQPAIIAEALAQTAIHRTSSTEYLLQAESVAKSRNSDHPPNLFDLLREVQSNPAIRKNFKEGPDSVSTHSQDQLVAILSKWRVQEHDMEERLKQIYELCAYFTFAAQRPHKQVKTDFFFIHALNASVFLPAFIGEPSITTAAKCRLLEWKGRHDLDMYARGGLPDLLPDEIKHYEPRSSKAGISREQQWAALFDKACTEPDDSHAVKTLRALAAGEQLWKARGTQSGAISNDMWLQMAHMTVDSTGVHEPRYVRRAGFDSAWANVKDREEGVAAVL